MILGNCVRFDKDEEVFAEEGVGIVWEGCVYDKARKGWGLRVFIWERFEDFFGR